MSTNFSFNPFNTRGFNPEYFKNFNDLTPQVKTHLSRVYLTLTCMVAATSVGVWLSLTRSLVLGPLSTFALLFGSLIGLTFTGNYPDSSSLRQGLLLTFSLCEGVMLAPLINLAIRIDPKLVLIASTSTFLIFTSFTISSMFTQRRSYLYLGGILGASATVMFFMSVANSFLRYNGLYLLELYGGLLLFSLYILYDTQRIIELANLGQTQVINHALTLFTDLVAIFVRLLIILIKKNQEKEKEDKRNRSRSRSAY